MSPSNKKPRHKIDIKENKKPRIKTDPSNFDRMKIVWRFDCIDLFSNHIWNIVEAYLYWKHPLITKVMHDYIDHKQLLCNIFIEQMELMKDMKAREQKP